jgi:hypothetical protein
MKGKKAAGSRQQAVGCRQSSLLDLSCLPSTFCFLPSVFLCASLCCAVVARAQQQPDVLVPLQAAPPPMRYIPDAVRAQLSAARDPKERTRLAVAEADARIDSAEQHTKAEQYDAAAAELGIYEAIVTDAVTYLQGQRNDGHTRDLFKLMEQTLYKDSGRIEVMRRSTPPEYTGNLRAALNFARDVRSTALNAFYGTTVLREPPAHKNNPASNHPPADKPE